jgi:lipid-A-disaccharide synthase
VPRGKIRIAIVAAEVSGDLLAAGLIREIRKRLPDARFEGIGGPGMQAAGCRCFYPMDELTLIGFGDIAKLASILSIRRKLTAQFLDNPPDLFIGVDAPDFNIPVEETLKAAGIRTLHYVSPTVWAWRSYRIHRIRRAVDHMLTLFPFEERFYQRQGIPVTCVGHPLADIIPLRYRPADFRSRLGLPQGKRLIALLPGSRSGELHRHADLFVQTALWLSKRHDDLHFVAPMVNARMQKLFMAAIQRQGAGDLPISVQLNRSRDAMAAADVVLLASGTATLEAALLGKPMVVTYRVSWFSYYLIRLFSHVRLYSLPNNLAGREVVPELMQSDAVPEKTGPAIEHFLTRPSQASGVRAIFRKLHRSLRRNANVRAAQAVIKVLAPARRSPKRMRRRP